MIICNARDGFTRREVIARLIEFREEFGESFLFAEAPVVLVLRDIANLLGLDEEEELPQVLGPEVAEAISTLEYSRERALMALTEKGIVTADRLLKKEQYSKSDSIRLEDLMYIAVG